MVIETKIAGTAQSIQSAKSQSERLEEEIKTIGEQTKNEKKANDEKLKERIMLVNKRIAEEERKAEEITKEIAKAEYQKNESRMINETVLKLTRCPTCRQDVTAEHKHLITKQNSEKIEDASARLDELALKKEKTKKRLFEWKKNLLRYQEIQKKSELITVRLNLMEEKMKSVKALQMQIEAQVKQKEELEKEKANLQKNIRDSAKTEALFQKLKEELGRLEKREKEEEIRLARLLEQKNSIDDIISGLKKQVELKQKLKEKSVRMKKMQGFLSDLFENLMVSMEKHVMAGIYHEFNDHVKKWFETLIEDETLTLRLDSGFTPVLEQNGYETDISSLSGGEKTAVALSYRLALNKVVNSMISCINTKDIIILDEPTDGFSAEQLERVREVIDELNLKQVIIVSHEPKIESFVDNVIRIEKHGHQSVAERGS